MYMVTVTIKVGTLILHHNLEIRNTLMQKNIFVVCQNQTSFSGKAKKGEKLVFAWSTID